MSRAERVLEHLQRVQPDMLRLLEDLVTMETPSSDPASQQPLRLRLREEFERRGYRARLLPGRNCGGHLYAAPLVRPRRRPAQLLLGHCDTVWPLGTLAQMPLERSGDHLRGPGVYDMKAGLVAMLFALDALRAVGAAPEVTPLCLVNSDEEVGSRESTRYVRALAQRVERCFVLEPSLGVAGRLKTARKGVGRFTVTVHGKAAHAGLDPGAGASAILELSHVIQALFTLNEPERGVSVNVGVIDGGVRANVVAPVSRAIVDVRVETADDARRIEQAIRALGARTPGVSLAVEGGIGRPPMERTPANRRLWALARQCAAELGMELEEATAGGGSDGNTTSLYTATLDGLGAVGDGAHAAHEYIEISRLPQRCALLTLLLLAPPLDAHGAPEPPP